jgi:hypothetical protein
MPQEPEDPFDAWRRKREEERRAAEDVRQFSREVIIEREFDDMGNMIRVISNFTPAVRLNKNTNHTKEESHG